MAVVAVCFRSLLRPPVSKPKYVRKLIKKIGCQSCDRCKIRRTSRRSTPSSLACQSATPSTGVLRTRLLLWHPSAPVSSQSSLCWSASTATPASAAATSPCPTSRPVRPPRGIRCSSPQTEATRQVRFFTVFVPLFHPPARHIKTQYLSGTKSSYSRTVRQI